jgi:hypothetical protein
VGAIMAMAYDFSNFTADDLLEAELAEEERVARAQARADKSAGTLNAFKALMRQPQTARANVISSDFDAASLKAYSQGKDVENLQHIRKTMSSVIGTPALPLNDIAKFNEWYKTQKFPYRFEKDIRTAYNNMSGELEKQSQAEHAATITRPAAELTFKTAEGVRDYDLKRPNRQAILQEVIANYKAPRAGIPRISTVQAITLLQNRLVAEGTKQPDIDRAVDHLKEVIALQQDIEEGEINTTVGVISSQVFDELNSGVYGEDPVAWTDALAKYDELISNYRGISEDQASKGRQKIDNLIAKMQAAITEERAVAAETQRVKVTRPKEALALRTAEAESRKLEGIDVRNLSQSKVGIVARYADSRNRDDWYLAREELQSIIDAQRTAGAVFTGSQIDQQFEELERSLAHLEPIVWTGDIKEVKQMTALADPTGKTKLQATIDRGMAVEAIKMGIRKDPILSQMEFFKNNINSYANGLVKALISNATGVYGSTIYYDPDADEILLIRDIPAHLGKTQETALIVNQPPSVDEEEALKAHGVLWISFAGTKGKL